jgi:hypothetical protein
MVTQFSPNVVRNDNIGDVWDVRKLFGAQESFGTVDVWTRPHFGQIRILGQNLLQHGI